MPIRHLSPSGDRPGVPMGRGDCFGSVAVRGVPARFLPGQKFLQVREEGCRLVRLQNRFEFEAAGHARQEPYSVVVMTHDRWVQDEATYAVGRGNTVRGGCAPDPPPRGLGEVEALQGAGQLVQAIHVDRGVGAQRDGFHARGLSGKVPATDEEGTQQGLELVVVGDPAHPQTEGPPRGAVQNQQRLVVEEQESALGTLQIPDVRFQTLRQLYECGAVGNRVRAVEAARTRGSARTATAACSHRCTVSQPK